MPGLFSFFTPLTPHPGLPQFKEIPFAVIGHRGASGHAPENTMPAFEMAVEMGVHALEMDVQLTADGHVVVIHDGTVDRTTDGTGRVRDFTLEHLKRLDAGYHFQAPEGDFPYRDRDIRISTLEEVLDVFGSTPIILEMKADSGTELVEATAEVILRFEATERVIIGSFDTRFLRTMRGLIPGIATTLGNSEVRALWVSHWPGIHRWHRVPGDALMIPESANGLQIITRRFVTAAHLLGMEIYVWTVNEPDDMQRLIRLGVDGIITNYPDRLRAIIEEE